MLARIQEIVEAISNSYGDNFFSQITLALNKVVGADYTFIARNNNSEKTCKTDVFVANGKLAENFEYSLKNTPCAKVIDNSVCYYPKNVCASFPEDHLLNTMHIKAYIGTPLIDSKQNVIGLLVALYTKDQTDIEDVSTLFKLFSGRISAEFERLAHEHSLEEKIAERTQDLSTMVEELQDTQTQLIESEKMSALGSLVAGVSHEVNTPLGIAITTHSLLAEEHKNLADKVGNHSLSITDMEHFIQNTDKALTMQGENLRRAKQLISNFKKTAADQHQLGIETINIQEYYHQVISTLRSILKPYAVDLTITCSQKIILSTYPGIHAQIITNLITNTVKHGFFDLTSNDNQEQKRHNTIEVNINQTSEGLVEVTYKDNGWGLSEEAKTNIFEPFFTTAKSRGGIGLGMSIVYNLITKELNGSIELGETEIGACFIYKFKESATELPSN